MRLAGFLLLVAGWGIVLAAVILLGQDIARNVFVVAGIAVEGLGLALAVRSHAVLRREPR